MAARRPPPAPPVPPTPPGEGDLDGRIREGDVERMRRQAKERGFQNQIQKAAKARGQDPYEMLAQAIRQLLRGD